MSQTEVHERVREASSKELRVAAIVNDQQTLWSFLFRLRLPISLFFQLVAIHF
jgi:hypothetical protein